MGKIIEVKNLTVKAGDYPILENISFDVQEQEIVALIGPNGSGKTTLIKVLLGLMPATSGSVKVNTKSIGYVPQRLEFDRGFPMSVEELFLIKMQHGRFWFRSKTAKDEIKKYLRYTGAEKLYSKLLGQLSGGEMQRVLIAHSLIDQPKILFLDEPLAGVDVGGEETIQDMIERLHEQFKLTILLVSHDLEVVYKHAVKVICINRQLVCFGVPGEVLTTENLEKLYGKVKAFYHHHGEHSAG